MMLVAALVFMSLVQPAGAQAPGIPGIVRESVSAREQGVSAVELSPLQPLPERSDDMEFEGDFSVFEEIARQSLDERRLWKLGVGLSTGLFYTDNPSFVGRSALPDAEPSELFWTLSPRLSIDVDPSSERWSFSGRGSAVFRKPIDGDDEGLNDYSGSLSLPIRWTDGIIGISTRTGTSTSLRDDLDVGGRLFRFRIDQSATAEVNYSEKSGFGVSALYSAEFEREDAESDIFTGTLSAFAAYQYSDRTRLTFALAYINEEKKDRFTNEVIRPSLAVDYLLSDKVSLFADAGLDFRRFDDGATDASPSGGVTGSYRVANNTLLSASAYARTRSSSGTNADVISSYGGVASVTQTFFQRFSISVNGGYDNSNYQSGLTGEETGRTEDFYFFGGSIGSRLGNRTSINAYYRYSFRERGDIIPDEQRNEAGISFTIQL